MSSRLRDGSLINPKSMEADRRRLMRACPKCTTAFQVCQGVYCLIQAVICLIDAVKPAGARLHPDAIFSQILDNATAFMVELYQSINLQ